MDRNAKKRVRKAQATIKRLIKKGTPFNIKKVSGSTLQTALQYGKPGMQKKVKKEIIRRTASGKNLFR